MGLPHITGNGTRRIRPGIEAYGVVLTGAQGMPALLELEMPVGLVVPVNLEA